MIGRNQTANRSEAEKKVVETAGEIFPDGSIIELVTVANGLSLLFCDGKKTKIAPEIEHRGQCYRPISINESMRRAIPMPIGAISYGSISQLLGETVSLFQTYAGLPIAESALAAGWSASSWVSDLITSPLPLLITGRDMDRAMRLLRLSWCIGRRSLLLTDISRPTLRNSPMDLWPTLLVNQPDVSPKILSSWRASNYDGIFVPGKSGSVSHVACAKALYLADKPLSVPWCDSAPHIALSPLRPELPPLGPAQLAEITDRFQPRWLQFRLENVAGFPESRQAPSRLNLPACIEDEPDFAKALAPLIERQREETLARRARDVERVIVEVAWVASHEADEISVDKITKLTNSLLRERGEILVYSNEEIGWKMRNLGFYRPRNGSGKYLKFSRNNRLRIHQLAQDFGLDFSPVSGCSDCTPPEVIVPEEVMQDM